MFLIPTGNTVTIARAEISYLSNGNVSSGTPTTYSSVSLGAAQSDRVIVVQAYGRRNASSAGNVTALTIGGVSATLITTQTALSAGHENELWYAVVPSGTTGDIVITWNAGMAHNAYGAWRITGAITAPSDSGQDGQVNPVTEPLTIPAGGVAVGCVGNAGGSQSHTWTNLNEDYDVYLTGDDSYSGAHAAFSSLSTDLSIQCLAAVAGSNQRMCIAAWGPA